MSVRSGVDTPLATAPSAAASPGRRGMKLYFVASIVAQVAALVRYVTLARLLGPEQLGLAATLVVTASFFDLISDTGSDRFLIQDRDGDTEAVQKLVQLVWAARGAMIAVAMAVFSIPLAHFYNAPGLAIGFAILALSPLIAGFTHLDIRRAQRLSDFSGESICSLASEVASLIATTAAAWLTHDFTAILYGLITRAVVSVAVSHLIGRRRYAMAWNAEHGARLARFSAPLMASGLMLFVGSQGDRVLVATQLGVGALGEYSAVILLIFYPSAIILRYMHAIFMPLVSAHQFNPVERDQISERLGGQTMVLGLAMSVGFAVVAPFMVTVLYGHRYSQAPLLVGLIGILQATRFIINWPSTVSLSLGRSSTVMISNLTRLFVFPGAMVGYWLHGGLTGVVVGFIFGETISIAVSLYLLNRDTQRPPFSDVDRFVIFLLFGGAIVGWNGVWVHPSWWLAMAMTAISVALSYWLYRREEATFREGLMVAYGFTNRVFASKRRLDVH